MTYKYASAGSLLAAMLAVAAPRLGAQAANNTQSTVSGEDETIELSPFIIQAAEDPDSYAAKSTLAGTRIRTDLKDVGSAIQVVTSKFLQDTGATSSQTLLTYTTNTEVGGQYGNFVGAGAGQTVDTRAQRSNPQTNTRVRGLAAADNTRDFFLTDIPWDSYNVGRVDLQRGPNSILFGIGSPAGIVNSSLNTASMKDANAVEFRLGSFGSTRESVDLNKVIIRDQLAVRVTGLNDETKYQQDPAFQHDKRNYAALVYRPSFLKKNGMSTEFRANYETGHIVANRPRLIPPIDAISPWFTAMNKQTFDARNMGKSSVAQTTPGNPEYSPDNGAVNRTRADGSLNPNFQPYLAAYGGQIFDQPVAAFGNQDSSAIAYYFMPSLNATGIPTNIVIPWSVAKGISSYHDYATNANLPNNQLGAYRDKTLADSSIFDFYNKLIDGPNKKELQSFHSYNLAASQTFLDNRIGFDIAYDRQKYEEEDGALIGIPYLTVEVLNTLPDGRANPNVGRPLVVGSPYSNSNRFTDRRAFRATGFAELNFADYLGKSTLSSILGHHRFTGLYSTQSKEEQTLTWYSYVAGTDFRAPPDNRTLDSRRIPSVSYLGGSLLTASSAAGADIPNIEARQAPYNGSIRDFHPVVATDGRLVSTPPNYNDLVGWTDSNLTVMDGYSGRDRARMIKDAHKFKDLDKATAFVWQGFFWEDTIVPTFGYRKDKSKNLNAGDPSEFTDQSQAKNYSDPLWTLPSSVDDPRVGKKNVTFNEETGTSRSWSVVVHTPKFLREKLPLGTDISLFYNKSDNFQPAGGRTDIFGHSLASPTGKTRDMGVTISTLNDKLALKINWYKTEVKNQTLEATNGIVYRIGSNEAWGYMFASWAKNNVNDFTGGNNYALNDPKDPASGLIDPAITQLVYQPQVGQSVADAYAQQQAAINTFLDPKNLPPADFDSAWGINNRATWDPTRGWAAGGLNWSTPASLAVTGDTSSKGTEYELTAQPTAGWNITINASKTNATRLNLASSFASWVDARNTYYQGPAGDVRLWNNARDSQTVRSVWNSEFYAYYLLFRLQEGADVPELRPWHVNMITNYDFRNGALKGWNVGGSWRWEDGIVTGYPVKDGFYDIGNPYKGPSRTSIDLWVGYERKLNKRLTWRTQLNVRNVFADKDLIPITVEPDGSPATSSIPEPRVITWTNTLKF